MPTLVFREEWMNTVFKPLFIFGLSSAVSFGVLYLADDPSGPGASPLEAAASSRSHGYDLTRLDLLDETLDHIRESYVEPERVVPDEMYTAALEAVEREVPAAMFRREGSTLSVQAGEHRTILDVGEVGDLDELSRQLRRVATILREHLEPGDIPDPDDFVDPYAMVEFAMANGALSTLDPHSLLLPPAESKEMDVENRGEFGGLGISILMENGTLKVDYPMPGTPAHRAGVQAGDEIRRIDFENTINLTIEEAVELLRGPVGAPVTLEVVRRDVEDPFDIVVQRDNIKVSPVEAFPLGGGYAYARVRTFHASAAADLRDEIAALARAEGPVKGLVLDLRDNPGGYLNQAVAVANLFLDFGEIVSTRSPHDFHPAPEVADARNTQDPYPMAVLVNANSASASEIVAGALRNNERAVIVGERTFGKGSVQNLHAIPHDSKLKITIAQYLTPGERSIQSVGIPADIELVPTFVGMRESARGLRPAVSLFSRDSVRREADLAAHLESGLAASDEATYVVRYHEGWDAQRPLFDAPDPKLDFEVGFALSLLQATPTSHRSEALAVADRLVRRVQADNDRKLSSAFDTIGVDWRVGPVPDEVEVEVDLVVDAAGLVAGRWHTLRMDVTNRGDEPFHQLVAVTAGHELLDGLEFPIGYVPPGATRSFSKEILVEEGYPSEHVAVVTSLRGPSGRVLATEREQVDITGRPLPELAWRWRMVADEDGSVDVGDIVKFELDVRNLGEGPTSAASARIKSRAGRTMDILSGTLRPGSPQHADGSVCDPETEASCRYVLAPGETWTGSCEIKILEPMMSGYGLHLSLGDGEAFDYGAVVRAGFYSYFRQEEELTFKLGEPGPDTAWRQPPEVRLTRVPPLESSFDLVTVSGRAADAEGVAHVMVYAGEDKVFFHGSRRGEELPAVPFSADIPLKPGRNTVSVLATDAMGLTSTTSRVIYLDTPEQVSKATLEP